MSDIYPNPNTPKSLNDILKGLGAPPASDVSFHGVKTPGKAYAQIQSGLGLSGTGPTSISIVGDSLAYGTIGSSGGVASPKIHEKLQAILRSHYGTGTVINCGAYENPAATTQNYLDGSLTLAGWQPPVWSSEVLTSGADAFILFLGMNDSFYLTVDKYRSNLLEMALLAIRAGKTVVIATPSFSSYAAGPSTTLASFAEAARQVAAELNIVCIDIFKFVQRYASERKKSLVHADGVHPEQALYNQIATQLAAPFIAASTLDQKETLSALTANAIFVGPSIVHTGISRFGGAVQCTSASVAFYTTEDRLKINLHLARASEYANTVKVELDGDTIFAALDITAYGLTIGASFNVEYPICVSESVTKGLHFLKVSTNDAKPVCLGGLSTEKPALLINDGIGSSVRTALISKSLSFGAPSGQKAMIFDQVLNMVSGSAQIEFTADLSAGFYGVGLMAYNEAGVPFIDVIIFAVPGPSNLRLIEVGVTQTDFPTVTAVTGSKAYRLIITPASVQCFVDGVSYGSVALTRKITGGFIGVWTNSAAGKITDISTTL